MPRVSVPEDYDGRDVPLPDDGEDYDSLEEFENTTGRVAGIREDEDGRYVGVPEQYVEDVREYLGVEATESDDDAESSSDDDGDADDGESEDSDDAEPEAAADDESGVDVETVEDCLDDGECPWCDEYEGDGVPQHASSAHSEEWTAYKEASE